MTVIIENTTPMARPRSTFSTTTDSQVTNQTTWTKTRAPHRHRSRTLGWTDRVWPPRSVPGRTHKVDLADPPQLRQVLKLQEHLPEAGDVDARQHRLRTRRNEWVFFFFSFFFFSSAQHAACSVSRPSAGSRRAVRSAAGR